MRRHVARVLYYSWCIIVAIVLVSANVYVAVADATDIPASTTANTDIRWSESSEEAVPTLETPDFTVYVIFNFGGLWAIARNNTNVMPPILVYAYSKDPAKPVTATTNYGEAGAESYGLLLNITKYEYYQDLVITINNNITLVFKVVKTEAEVREEKVAPGITLEQLKQWLDKEAQAAAITASVAIIAAFAIKRKTLLIKVFNALNIAVLIISSIAIYYVAKHTGHSEWLIAVFIPSYLISYAIIRVGRKVYLIKIMPSLRKVLWETAVLYRTAEGWLAYAKQSVSEAFRRMLGKHIVLKDAEINSAGEMSEDKFWSVEDIETYEHADGLLVLDAVLTKEKVFLEHREGELYRGGEE